MAELLDGQLAKHRGLSHDPHRTFLLISWVSPTWCVLSFLQQTELTETLAGLGLALVLEFHSLLKVLHDSSYATWECLAKPPKNLWF